MIIRLDVTESGLAALVRLCSGDMRKALNILQVMMFLFNCCFLTLVATFLLARSEYSDNFTL